MADKAEKCMVVAGRGDDMPPAATPKLTPRGNSKEPAAAPQQHPVATIAVLTEVSGALRTGGLAATPSKEPAVPFTEDLKTWAASTSEVFNLSIFLTELVGQTLFSVLGPLSYPLLLCVYGSWDALRNRSFFYSTRGKCDLFWIIGMVCWGTTLAAFALWLIYRPRDVMTIELKLVLVSLYFKNAAISVKYSFMAPRRWRQLRKKQSLGFNREGFMIKWFFQVADTVANETEVALIGVLGTRMQRESLQLKFLGWPSTVEELDSLRHKVDKTSRAMYQIPNGGISEGGVLSRRSARCTDLTEGEIAPQRSQDSVPDPEEENERIFAAASSGKVLPVQDLFRYMLGGMLRNEEWLMPRKFLLTGVVLSVLFVVFLPSFVRLSAGRGFLGDSWQSAVIVVCLWPNSLTGLMSTLIFLWTGMKDFWRRWTLMRSCSALLSLEHGFRFGCPPEVQRLPLLDCTDIKTIEAWRKLRSLCRDWGAGYFNRVKGFALVSFVMICLIIGDSLACMYHTRYREQNDFNLAHLILVGFVGALFMAYIIAMVTMGQNLNDSAGRHLLLLSRQRLHLTYSTYELAIAAADEGRAAPDPGKARLLSDYIDAVAADIAAEMQVNPVRLLGLYCGYALLAFTYLVPFFAAASVANFCASDEWERCQRLI